MGGNYSGPTNLPPEICNNSSIKPVYSVLRYKFANLHPLRPFTVRSNNSAATVAKTCMVKSTREATIR